MKVKTFHIPPPGKGIVRIVLVTVVILMVPLVAMQFSNDVKWDPRDFIIVGVLLIATGLIYELVVKRVKDPTRRTVFAAMLFVALLLIWMDLAVGIFNTPFSGS